MPAGTYTIRFTKDDFQSSRLADFEVKADQLNPGDVALTPAKQGSIAGVEEIVVTGELKAPEANRELADEVINVLGPEELAKFAASDIAEAIKRIPGINVVEGQFAIIRGLEDRYSSTLYNGAPVPSPDPDKQSVQLDLFPSEVTSNLVVAKTFAPELPSNSSGGAIDIITHDYPEEFEVKIGGGSGYNTNAGDHYLGFVEDSPIGKEGGGVTEGEFNAFVGGRTQLAERELSLKGVFSWELDYTTREGTQHAREPRAAEVQEFPTPPTTIVSGDLSLGELNLSLGKFDFTESDRVEQTAGYLDLGFDIDPEGNHHVDVSAFYTKKEELAVQQRLNGYFPECDYVPAVPGGQPQLNGCGKGWVGAARETASDPPSRGPLWFANKDDSRAFNRDRDLLVIQVNGEHAFEAVEGLRLTWAWNWSETTQDEEYLAARYFYEPEDFSQIPTEFPTTPESLGPGTFADNGAVFWNTNAVDEVQYFGRVDLEYEFDVAQWATLKASSGLWYEDSDRTVDASYLESPLVGGASQFAILGDTPLALGKAIPQELQKETDGDFAGTRDTSSHGLREIVAWSLGLKATLWEDLDVLAGLRSERLKIESINDPFTGELFPDGTPRIFPAAFLMFDRPDNPSRPWETTGPPPPGITYNDQVLGIDVKVNPATGFVDLITREEIENAISGRIDERHYLPSVGVTYRPLDGLALRGAFSRTLARPSLREMGYYISVEPASDDLVIGNPQLQLSHVESWDLRAEYMWGAGDLAAVSGFIKSIDDPIESIVIRDPIDSTLNAYRTFFNNQNQASLRGIELEARKALDFVGVDALQYLSLAANFTYIDAEVERSPIERQRASGFFAVTPTDKEHFSSLSKTRRLFGQPEWIANGDVTFDHPDWGTKLTLSVFAISDVLDAAGSVTLQPNGDVVAFSLDRYIDSYYQVDLVASQRVSFQWLPGDLTIKASLKNLTDSTRRLIYDPGQTIGEIAERSFTVGRDLSVSLTYDYSF